ncbi:MAG TPA: acyltransferase [Steroidobacteraceae bacterium]|nr:acyltransferase [Steroidobacteraceae bacterium]
MSSNEFHQNVHSLRALAIYSIVAGHVIEITPWPPGSIWPRLLSSLFEDGSVVFVFVAGYLFQHLHRRFRYFHYLRRKLSRVIVPYLIVAIPAIVLTLSSGNVAQHYPQLAGKPLVYQIGWMYLTGGSHVNFALWFIPMIAIFYVAAPLFSAMVRHPVAYWILLPLIVVSTLLHRVPYPSLAIIHMALYLLPAYIAGMWWSQFGSALTTRHVLSTTTLLAATVVVLALPWVASSHAGNYEEPGYFTFTAGVIDWLFLARLATAFLLLLVLARTPAWLSRRLTPFAATSFGVFFVHCYWLQLFVQFHNWVATPGILTWLLTTTTIFAASYWSVIAVDRLFPNAAGYLVGYFRPARRDDPVKGPVLVAG